MARIVHEALQVDPRVLEVVACESRDDRISLLEVRGIPAHAHTDAAAPRSRLQHEGKANVQRRVLGFDHVPENR